MRVTLFCFLGARDGGIDGMANTTTPNPLSHGACKMKRKRRAIAIAVASNRAPKA